MTYRQSSRLSVLAALAPLVVAVSTLAQPCSPFWAGASPGMPYYPQSLAVYDDGAGPALYAGVAWAGGYALRWSGRTWVDLSATLPTSTLSIARSVWVLILNDGAGPSLYTYGRRRNQNQIDEFWIRRWDGTQWVPTHPALLPIDGSAYPIMSGDLGDGQRIYGMLYNPDTQVYQIARWSGTQWDAMTQPFFPYSIQLAIMNQGSGPRLYAVGQFQEVNGVVVNGFARWTGSTWERPPSDHNFLSGVKDVTVFDDGTGPALYVSGTIRLNVGGDFPGVGRWDGQHWTNVGGPFIGPGGVYTRGKLAVFDDGRGPALYINGGFDNYGGISARGIVRWDGSRFEPVGYGITGSGNVEAMVVAPDIRGRSLFIGGQVFGAAGGTSPHVLQLVGCPNCYADCDLSGSLNVNDFICYINKYAAKAPEAECDSSTTAPTMTISDFVCYISKYTAGCP